MRSNNRSAFLIVAVIVSGLLTHTLWSLAQGPQVYKARLSIVPIAGAANRAPIDESATVFAAGNVTATLNGSKLTVTGSFEGFKSPASIAQIHQSVVMGVRGPVVFDLTVTKATKGTISGTFDLTPDQVNLLKNSRLYVQIHNENTPEGALWGWFLK
jgi:CHRD domain